MKEIKYKIFQFRFRLIDNLRFRFRFQKAKSYGYGSGSGSTTLLAGTGFRANYNIRVFETRGAFFQ
jgi:hypothetical protein